MFSCWLSTPPTNFLRRSLPVDNCMKCNNRTVPHQNFAFWCGIVFGKVYGWWGNRLLQSLNWPVNPFWRIMLRLGWCELALQPDAHDWVGDCYAVLFYSVGSGDFWQVDCISEFIEREAFFLRKLVHKMFFTTEKAVWHRMLQLPYRALLKNRS